MGDTVNSDRSGSSNGIICLFEYGKGINLWNPATRRKLTTQDRPSWCSWNSAKGPFYTVFGFGYDPILEDYKILRWTKPDTYAMYTLTTDTWCEIRGPATLDTNVASSQCLFNGTLHWVVQCKLIDQSEGMVYNYHIMAFDLSADVFSAIPLPEKSWGTRQVTIMKGFLAVMSSEDDNTCIWVRKEESWSVAFNINTIGFGRASKVLQLPTSGYFLLKSFQRGVLVYNPATHLQSRLEKLKGSKRLHSMELCIEGLGLLHMGTSC
uniref:F-box/kelch-repeat protein At3g23880-like n=1 Tax=Erigeron canadensis TaxID=72917 RepID=UPI001CB95F1F|nr:F-box/kelch-repeat protein At3g23880-like [Erigeron canadensis]